MGVNRANVCGFLCLTAGKEKKMQQKRRVRFLVCGVVFTALAALYFLIALMGAAINSDIDEGKTQEFADVVKDAGYAIPDAEGGVFRIRLSEKSAVLMVLFPESAEDPSDLEAIRGQQPIRFRIRSRDAEAFGNGEAVEVVELNVAGDPVITLESYNRCRGEIRRGFLLTGIFVLALFGGIAAGMYFANAEDGRRFRQETTGFVGREE